ncbi:MAG: helix-turn-helix transcriptional regulator [Prevotella sp.]|nr:helix-turn-helix transcriptional regulator [Prevotella sp.]
MADIDLKRAIKAQGFTLDSVAQEMGVTKSAMSQLVNGNPTLSKLQEIAQVLGIPVAELLRFESNGSSHARLTCPHCGREIELEVKCNKV